VTTLTILYYYIIAITFVLIFFVTPIFTAILGQYHIPLIMPNEADANKILTT